MCRRRNEPERRIAVTLTELMMALAIMGLLAAAMTALATSVEVANEQSRGQNTATQHARVAIDHIERNLRSASATADYPGFLVVPTTVGTTTYPDAVIIWKPETGTPQNASGPPLMKEIVVYAVSPTNANELWELRNTTDNRASTSWTDLSAWRTEIATLFTATGVTKSRLTDLLRTGASSTSNGASTLRGAVRFEIQLRPSATEWSEFQAGTRAWSDLSWVQGIYGKSAGLRQSWCRIELQLMPSKAAATSDTTGQSAIPFFGSGALYYELTR